MVKIEAVFINTITNLLLRSGNYESSNTILSNQTVHTAVICIHPKQSMDSCPWIALNDVATYE